MHLYFLCLKFAAVCRMFAKFYLGVTCGPLVKEHAVCVWSVKGGMKAVMWTDVLQICFMFAGILAVIINGSLEHGGFGHIWSIMYDDQRIQFWE